MTTGTVGGSRLSARVALGVALGLALGASLVGCTSAAGPGDAGEPAWAEAAIPYETPVPAPPLDLLDERGKAFSLSDVRGAAVLVFFGYTHCPDVCPTTIGELNEVLRTLGERVRAVFVTIDPERDTPDAMREYLGYLPEGYTGLSGSAGDIRAAADGYGVAYARIDSGSAAGYAMSHTADVFVIDPDGRLVGRFPYGTEAAAITADLERLIGPGVP